MSSAFVSSLNKVVTSMEPLTQLTIMFPGDPDACEMALDASGGAFSLAHEFVVEHFGPAKMAEWEVQERNQEEKAVSELKVRPYNVVPDKKDSASVESSLPPNRIKPRTMLNMKGQRCSLNSSIDAGGSFIEPWIIEGVNGTSAGGPSEGVDGEENDAIRLEDSNLTERTSKTAGKEELANDDPSSKIADDDEHTTISLDKAVINKRKIISHDEELPKKKARKEPAKKLDYASVWISKKYGNCTEEFLVKIQFSDGKVHPIEFPLTAFANIVNYEELFEETDSPMQAVLPEGVTQEIFDIAMQRANCGVLQVNHQHRREKQIKVLLSVVPFGTRAGIQGIEEGIISYLKAIIKKERAALVGAHIKTAFKLPSPHPIQELLINAAVIPCLHYHEVDDEGKVTKLPSPLLEEEDDYPTPAHRNLARGNGFRYAWAMENIPKFELGVLRKCMAAQHRRGIKRCNQDRGFPDPLTGEMINLEDFMDF